jgi:signal transduction histidine kinase
MRLTLLYGGLFLASSVAALALVDAFLLGMRSVRETVPAPTGGAPTTELPGSALGAVHHTSNVHLLIIVSAVAVPFLAVGSFTLAWVVAGRVLRPLRTIMSTAREISARNLHERLGVRGPYDEFQQLGDTLDDLFGRLESSFELQRRFVANASHELRTPLTAERTLLQVALADPEADSATLRSTCEELLVLSRQQERLIDALLTLATSERQVERWDDFDLAEVAGKVVDARRTEAERRGIQLGAHLVKAPAAGDPGLVEILVANLVDNALCHNVDGGCVEIMTGATGSQATLSVANTGPAVPPGEVARLFQPFQRLGRERTGRGDGHGLGLTIVAAIANAHGAVVEVRPRPAGGLDVAVAFSAALTRAPDPQAAA